MRRYEYEAREALIKTLTDALHPVLYSVEPQDMRIQKEHHDICEILARHVVSYWPKAIRVVKGRKP